MTTTTTKFDVGQTVFCLDSKNTQILKTTVKSIFVYLRKDVIDIDYYMEDEDSSRPEKNVFGTLEEILETLKNNVQDQTKEEK